MEMDIMEILRNRGPITKFLISIIRLMMLSRQALLLLTYAVEVTQWIALLTTLTSTRDIKRV